MRAFIAGVIIAIVGFFAIALVVAQFGFLPTSADATPPDIETRIASNALDASMERHAPRVKNPYPVNDDNLIAGMKIYNVNCSACHGTMDLKPSVLQHSMYPPPPQLLLDPLDDPEWHIYYAIRTGVRYTGMPAWNHAMSDQDIWKVTAFLSRVDRLPPAAQTFWKDTYGTTPPTPHDEHEQGGNEHKD